MRTQFTLKTYVIISPTEVDMVVHFYKQSAMKQFLIAAWRIPMKDSQDMHVIVSKATWTMSEIFCGASSLARHLKKSVEYLATHVVKSFTTFRAILTALWADFSIHLNSLVTSSTTLSRTATGFRYDGRFASVHSKRTRGSSACSEALWPWETPARAAACRVDQVKQRNAAQRHAQHRSVRRRGGML